MSKNGLTMTCACSSSARITKKIHYRGNLEPPLDGKREDALIAFADGYPVGIYAFVIGPDGRPFRGMGFLSVRDFRRIGIGTELSNALVRCFK